MVCVGTYRTPLSSCTTPVANDQLAFRSLLSVLALKLSATDEFDDQGSALLHLRASTVAETGKP